MGDAPPPRVFISYAHDSEEHKRHVHAFARFLRADVGIDVRFDMWDTERRRDWATWMISQLEDADFVLVIASPAYKRRADGRAEAEDGRGVQFEASLLRDLLSARRPQWTAKILPVVLPGHTLDEIPAFLQPYTASHYQVSGFSLDGIDELYRVITGQPRFPTPGMGALVVRPPETPEDTGDPWPSGHQVRVGQRSYLVRGTVPIDSTPSWSTRQAIASDVSRPNDLVTLRELRLVRPDESAARQRAAFEAEAMLLADLAAVPGFPRLLGLQVDPHAIVLAFSRETGHTLRDLYRAPLAAPRLVGFLETIRQLCASLQALHERGLGHQRLTLDAVVLAGTRQTPFLLDLGSSALGAAHHTAASPLVDVHDLAVMVRDTISEVDIRRSPRLNQLLADSLNHHRQPRNAAAFGAALTEVVEELHAR
ncbi:SEFIR domain-containing protein [Actinokineospora fastidiosa]|uniref:SEFIR domain-containing protein n=1 Tax=Actinokineospora fastidiosa TaxID=1816 RepID=A0A918GSL6_9PSEU|nr:SEFIR domain-containing protein [Actinokineospora fastidiosa]GGS54730.1 hypothetical protein GCM10010171_57350 [Actinokineospora fastidiosa]